MDAYQNYIGLVLDNRYRLKRLVGIGGMAMVFEADDLLKKTTVAVKILKEEFAADEVSVQRFINESKAVLMLSHPNIVKIVDVSVKGEYKYIVMEYIDGITLKAYMQRKGALSVKETIAYSIQILRALEHAHLGGVVHRDIKPQNIMLLRSGQIKVTDFGIAKLPDAKTLTATDKAIGTVYYISPEQAAGEKGIDRRADLYSVGVMMYEMITGKLPFDGENPVSIALKQISEEPKPPHELNPNIPEGLEQIILFAMEKDKDKRFQTATQMIDLLKRVRENPGVVFKQKTPSKKHEGRQSKKGSMLPIIMGVASAFLLVALISAFTVVHDIFFSDTANNTVTIEVEQFVGRAYDDALQKELEKSNYRVRVNYTYSADTESGMVIAQTPKAGESRKGIKGQKFADLALTVSRGEEELYMDDYAYYDKRQAQIDLRGKGFTVTVSEDYSDVVPDGCVISTSPAAGEKVSAGATIVLLVSKGEKIETTVVPNFVGTTSVDAYELLVKSDLRLGTISYRYDEYADYGIIVEQSLSMGTTVPKGMAKINFIISKGPEPAVTAPVTAATTEPTESTEPAQTTTDFDDWLSGRFH
ncbi:MAG: serine/threonine-protein kinase [Oscillospiraceae bacterium]|nr:MAG: serine/threonine-protein kinase [Oscillospiraceae bacterium]